MHIGLVWEYHKLEKQAVCNGITVTIMQIQALVTEIRCNSPSMNKPDEQIDNR